MDGELYVQLFPGCVSKHFNGGFSLENHALVEGLPAHLASIRQDVASSSRVTL